MTLIETDDITAYELVKISSVGGLFCDEVCLFFNDKLECIEVSMSELNIVPVVGRFYVNKD